MRELDEILRLREFGVHFDYYMMDAFWYDRRRRLPKMACQELARRAGPVASCFEGERDQTGPVVQHEHAHPHARGAAMAKLVG
jgi:hypothetical protein